MFCIVDGTAEDDDGEAHHEKDHGEFVDRSFQCVAEYLEAREKMMILSQRLFLRILC